MRVEKIVLRKENIASTNSTAFAHSTLAAKGMRELNWKPGQSAELSVLGEEARSAPGRYSASMLELSGNRMRLAAELPAGMELKAGSAVRLEWEAQLLLGQVLNTEPGGFWMEIHHMLLDTGAPSWQKNGWQRAG